MKAWRDQVQEEAIESSGHKVVATVYVDSDSNYRTEGLTTNIAFDESDMQTAFVTLLSATGRIGKLRWPTPRLRLPHTPDPVFEMGKVSNAANLWR